MKTGRSPYSFASIFYRRRRACHTSVATLTVLLQCPAFFCGCIPTGPIPVPALVQTKGYEADALDLFFFDAEGRLDAYQQLPQPGEKALIHGLSSTGAVQLAVLSARTGDTDRWWSLSSYPQLCKHSISLCDDSPAHPVLAGEARLESGSTRQLELALTPLMSCIRLCSVSCDFSGLPYAGTPLRSAMFFITYAGVEVHPLGAGDRTPVSWMNAGELDSSAVRRLPHPEMLMQEAPGPIGAQRVRLEQSFYFYPGPQSCLVVSGFVGDDYCYYPIPLRDLVAGRRRDLHITLTRKGSPDAATPVSSGTVLLEMITVPWAQGDSTVVSL